MTDRTVGLERFLHEHVPLARAMNVRVVAADASGLALSAPLAANANHHGTLFGGSATALAILAAWGWIHRFGRARLEMDAVLRAGGAEVARLRGAFVALEPPAVPGGHRHSDGSH